MGRAVSGGAVGRTGALGRRARMPVSRWPQRHHGLPFNQSKRFGARLFQAACLVVPLVLRCAAAAWVGWAPSEREHLVRAGTGECRVVCIPPALPWAAGGVQTFPTVGAYPCISHMQSVLSGGLARTVSCGTEGALARTRLCAGAGARAAGALPIAPRVLRWGAELLPGRAGGGARQGTPVPFVHECSPRAAHAE